MLLRFVASACIVFCLSPATWALEFQPRGNTEIISILDPEVDMALKIHLAGQARYSIDFMAYSMTKDESAMPFLQALRSAQARGVKVRGMYDRQVSATLEGDLRNDVKAVLTDPSVPCRGEVLCAHPIEKLSSGFSISDYIHGKMIVIDRGTPFEVVLTGGRGMTNMSARHLDSGMIIRRIRSGVPYAGDDLKVVFESIWGSLKKLAENSVIQIPTQVSRAVKIPGHRGILTLKGASQRKEFERIVSYLSQPPTEQADPRMSTIVFRPQAIEVFSNDLYEKLLKGIRIDAAFESDNHAKIIEYLDKFEGKIVLTAYSVSPDRPLHEALIRFVKRGNSIEFVTNGAEAYRDIGVPLGFPAYYTYERLIDLIEKAKGPGSGLISVFTLNPGKAASMGLPNYVHRKEIIYIGRDGIPVSTDVGSDNFTYSSAKKNDEVIIRVHDRAFSSHNHQRMLDERPAFDHHSLAQIKAKYAQRPFWYVCVRTLVRALF
jgi:phosphatidylserine/phosphatidylglycerophosphate/cardiolipin synthase-like enzyme